MRKSVSKTETSPWYLSTTEGWIQKENAGTYVKIVPVKVWSYQQYNECRLLVGGPGRWREANSEEVNNLSGFEKGLVFEAKPRQGKDGRPPVFVVRSVVRMVDDYIAGIADPYTTSPLRKADRAFDIPMTKWDAFVAHVRDEGGVVNDKSVQWANVEETFANLLDIVKTLSEIVAQESRVSGEPAAAMATYARLAAEARQAVDKLESLTRQLTALKEELDQEPGRFEEKVRLSAMVEQAQNHYGAFRDIPRRLHSKSQSPPVVQKPLLLETGQSGTTHDNTRWVELALALQKAYPDAVVTVKEGLVIARIGTSLVTFGEVIRIIT